MIRMTRRLIVRWLDRKGGRAVLGHLATSYARLCGHTGARVYYDGEYWIRSLDGKRFLVDAKSFDYETLDLSQFRSRFLEYRSITEDSWCWDYTPSEGDIVFDIGAGSGSNTLAFSERVGATGRVYAVEAHPETAAMLARLVKLNGASNVTIIPRAILSRSGEISIENKSAHTENRIIAASETSDGNLFVRGNSIDELCAEFNIQRIDLLKMNIEGAERLAIEGMEQALPRVKYAVIAAHDFIYRMTGKDWYRTHDLISAFLSSNGFQLRTRPTHAMEPLRDIIYARRPESAN